MSEQRIKVSGRSATLVDSCEGVRIQIAPSLVGQLADNAAYALKELAPDQVTPVNIMIQADPTEFTIKPTLTFEDGPQGMIGVVILEVEPTAQD